MKLITNINNVNVGDFIIFTGRKGDRVYRVLGKTNSVIFDREPVYSDDGGFSNSIIDNFDFITDPFWYLLNEKEINYYLKLAIFK